MNLFEDILQKMSAKFVYIHTRTHTIEMSHAIL